MAETSMNFGPEWIRTLTERGSGGKVPSVGLVKSGVSGMSGMSGMSGVHSSGPRYNKEEMLDRVRSMLSVPSSSSDDVSASQELMLPPEYLDKDYCRLDPSLWLKRDEEEFELRGSGLPANSEASLRFYKKEGLLANLSAEEGLGDPPFERHRSLDASSSKGPRSYERSMSDRGGGGGGGGRPKWYDRSNAEEKFNGTTSPRKTYTRVPFDDWRKTPSSTNSKDEEWRTVKQTNNRLSVWRSPLDNEAGFRKFEFSKSNTTMSSSSRNPKWREESSSSSSYKMSSSRGGGGGSYSSRGGVHASNFRRRQESTDTLPEWAHDDVPLEKIGGSFDSAGKFQQPFKAASDENENKERGKAKEVVLLDNVEEDRGEVEQSNTSSRVNHTENQYASNGNENHSSEKNEPEKEITLPSESERITPDQREKGPTPPSEERPLEEVGGTILSQLEDEEKKVPSGGTIPNSPSPARMNKPPMRVAEPVEEYKWIYLDPEGKTQGSFPSIQMLDWYQKGYFPPDLRLRRTIDKRFIQLSEFNKLCGYIPFLPGVQFPPLEAEDEVQKLQQQMIEREQATYMRQLQAQLIMQQLVQQQEHQQQQFISSLQQQQHQAQQPLRPDPPLLNKLMQMLGTNQAPPVTNSNMNLLGGGGGGVERPPLLNGPDQIPIHPTDPIKQLLAQQSINNRPPFSDVQNLNIQKPPQPTVPSPQNYDPIKSLLAQLQLSVQPPNAAPVPPATNQGNGGGGGGGGGGNYFNPNKPNDDPLSHRILSDAQQPPPPPPPPQQQQPPPPPQVQPVPTSINQSSIWDVEGNIPYKGAEPPISSVSQIWNKSNPHLAPQAMLNPSDERNFQIQQQQQQNLERLKQEELQKQEELLKKKELERQEELLRQQEELEKKKEELRLQQEQFEKQQQELLRQKELQQLNNGQFNNYRPLNEEPDNLQSNSPTPSNAHLETKELKLPGDHESNNMNINDFSEDVNFDDFVKPKFTEKKDRKNRKAEEKRKSREAKKESSMNHQKYIPGMEGSQKPDEPIVAGSQNNNHDDYLYEHETQEQALTRLREEQQAALIEKEKQQVPQQVPIIQPKLAPWAKKAEEVVSNNELSLAEIQKIEAECEREARIQKENREAQMRELMRVEEEPLITPKTNWQQSTQAEDFMQIVEEEYRLEKARQEKEKKNKKNRQKDLGLAQASVWGSGSSNLSWASKTSSNISVPQQQTQQQQPQNVRTAPIKTVVAPPAVGFWEDSPSISSQKPKNEVQHQQQSASPAQNKSKKSAKKGNSTKDESKQGGHSADSDKSKQRNAFEDWCTNALKSYSVQVDIPTFLSFLESIECPFEVNDYISSYIGEGKGPKSFAKEYLERRSKWKNSLKTANKMEDNLMAPATAINPGEISEFQSVKGNKSKNKRSKGGKAQKMDMSHLLGFSVASNRVNAGELDLPQ